MCGPTCRFLSLAVLLSFEHMLDASSSHNVLLDHIRLVLSCQLLKKCSTGPDQGLFDGARGCTGRRGSDLGERFCICETQHGTHRNRSCEAASEKIPICFKWPFHVGSVSVIITLHTVSCQTTHSDSLQLMHFCSESS